MEKHFIFSRNILFLIFLVIAQASYAQVNVPEAFKAIPQSQSQINLTWVDTGPTKTTYRVERSTDNQSFNEIGNTPGNVFIYEDKGLSPNTTYYYRIRAARMVFVWTNYSDYTKVEEATTFPTTPANPSGLNAEVKSQTEIDLTWVDNSNNEDGFYIDRSEKNSSNFENIATLGVDAQSFNDKNLKSNTTYFYRVRAFNMGGASAPSPSGSATTLPFAPTLDPIPDPAAINEDAGVQSLTIKGITDGGDGGQVITVNAVSDNTDLIPNPEVVYTSSNATGTIKYKPQPNKFGSATITVTVKDNGQTSGNISNSISQSFKVTVNELNDPPTLDAIENPGPIPENSDIQTVNLKGITAGPEENQSITINATSSNTDIIPNPSVAYTPNEATGVLTFKPLPNSYGKVTISVNVIDNGPGQAPHQNTTTKTFDVEVLWINKAPTLDQISNPPPILHSAGEQTIPLTGISAGPNDGQALTVTATSDNSSIIENLRVEYVSPSTTGAIKFSPTPGKFGESNITVTVMDDGPGSSPHVNTTSKTFKIKITDIPLIASENFPDLYTGGSQEQIGITLYENFTVDNVEFHYKKINEEEWQVLNITGNERAFSVPTPADEYFGPVGIDYYFKVYANGNLEEESTMHTTYLRYTGDGMVIPGLKAGNTEESYQIISIPLQLTQKGIPAVFEDDLGPYNPSQYRIFHFNGDTIVEHLNGIDNIEPGVGYWFISRHERPVDTGEGAVFQVDKENPFTILLKEGWNQIGNPYNMDISWENVLAFNNNPEGVGKLIVFDKGLVESNTLGRFRGGFVFSESELELKIPVIAPAGTTNGRLAKANSKSENNNGWEIIFKVESNTISVSGGLGMNANAVLIGKDPLDEVALPDFSFIQNLNIKFGQEKTKYTFPFSKDIVPLDENHIWDFSITSNRLGKTIGLTWSQPETLSKKLILVDEERNKVIDMLQQETYSFKGDSIRNFKVYYGDENFIENSLKPQNLSISPPYPNPFNGAINFTFTIPNEDNETHVELHIYDSTGKLIATPVNNMFTSGYHDASWNGENASGIPVPPGIYLYKFKAFKNNSALEYSGKIIRN